MINRPVNCAIIISSDRASSGEYQDRSGAIATSWLRERGFVCHPPQIVADNTNDLTNAVSQAISNKADLIVISGGTGLGPRDLTPQTLEKICDYQIPGFGELLRKESLKYSLNAYLSRCGAWLKDRCLILALPGNPNAVREQLDILADILPHALKAIVGKCDDRRAVKHT